jgi:hypothetical protein
MIPFLFVGGMGTNAALMLGFTAAEIMIKTNSTGRLRFW